MNYIAEKDILMQMLLEALINQINKGCNVSVSGCFPGNVLFFSNSLRLPSLKHVIIKGNQKLQRKKRYYEPIIKMLTFIKTSKFSSNLIDKISMVSD